MAKRFTDSEKWSKPWFRKLPPEMKLFWQFLLDNCDQAGLIDVDFELAGFCIGVQIDPEKAREHLEKQIHVLPDGKWFIKDFIEFQYRELREDCRPHKMVIEILHRYGIYDLWKEYAKGIDRVREGYDKGIEKLSIGYLKGIDTLKDKDKDKDKDKVKDKEKGKDISKGSNEKVWYDKQAEFWVERAKKHFKTVKIDKLKFSEDLQKLHVIDGLSKDQILLIQNSLAVRPDGDGFCWFDQIGTPGKLRERSKRADNRKYWDLILSGLTHGKAAGPETWEKSSTYIGRCRDPGCQGMVWEYISTWGKTEPRCEKCGKVYSKKGKVLCEKPFQ
jgi:hypothetical protein